MIAPLLNPVRAEPTLRKHLLDSTFGKLEDVVPLLGPSNQIPDNLSAKTRSYRTRQVCEWVFSQRASRFESMSNLPLDLREALSRRFSLRALSLAKEERSKTDGTVKFTFATRDKRSFSAVFIPHGEYQSLCISTQVGCAWGCRFCASGLVPFQRNLTPGEILDQVFIAEEATGSRIRNVLFMGMGEPLSNFHGTLGAIHWLTHANGFAMNPGRIVLSTTGLVPQIVRLAGEGVRADLALSLHAPSDALRKKIMPKSARFPVSEVLKACRLYQEASRSDLTIEYILLKGVNDSGQHAEELLKVLRKAGFRRLPKVNLIPFNPVPSIPYRPSGPDEVKGFFNFLRKKNVNVHNRKPRGLDLEAACGQLF